ncbi:MAG: hypothetical protein JRN15_24525 [Nitrososphaerota archaeon]|nr:hypothetical protein [Nitrososphaerota archaeon]
MLIVTILCGTAVALICYGMFTTHQGKLLTYTNQQFGFSFKYPVQWGKASVETVTAPTLRSSYQATVGNFWSSSGVAFSFSVGPLYEPVPADTYVTPKQFLDYLTAQSPEDVLTQENLNVGGWPALEATSVNGISHDETVYVPLNSNNDVLILEADLTRLSSSTFNTVLRSVHFAE